METYTVIVTGTWNLEIEADTHERAEELAYTQCLTNIVSVESMNLEFEAFNEEEENG